MPGDVFEHGNHIPDIEHGEFFETGDKNILHGKTIQCEYGDHLVTLVTPSFDTNSTISMTTDGVAFYFEEERIFDVQASDFFDRKVDFIPPVYVNGSPHSGKLTIRSGAHPHKFRDLMKKDVPADQINKFHLALVKKGMSCPLYHTREAASNVLVRFGLDALPALKLGLKNKDIEVRMRCEHALYRIRTGIEFN